MDTAALLYERLANQQIAAAAMKQPKDVVSYMVAMQAQEYGSAKWAIGLRAATLTAAAVEVAFNKGSILRTHVLRPTWHFVAPADIRWLLRLSAPRVHGFNAYMYRKLSLDAKLFARSNDVIAKSLEGGKHLTRATLVENLQHARIPAEGVALACILMYAELEGIICSGPREGKQHTYALLDERVPKRGETYEHDEALGQLAIRYFTSRAPATVKDFAWWAGLSAKDAKSAVAMLPDSFKQVTQDGQEYITTAIAAAKKRQIQDTFLMPNFDEYGISYKDRDIMKSDKEVHAPVSKNGVANPSLVVNGQIAGTWKAITKKNLTTVETSTYHTMSKAQELAIKKAKERYCSFADNQ